MTELLRRLGLDTLIGEKKPLVGEDFVWQPPTQDKLRVVHEEVFFEETPVALFRQLHLQHGERPHTSLVVRLALCWNGFHDALTLLERYSQSFQRVVPAEAAVNTTPAHGVGDFGVAWPWSGKGAPDVVAFVRNNVFASLEGHDAGALPVSWARELDAALARLRVVPDYGEASTGLLAEVRRRAGDMPRLAVGDRLDLGGATAEAVASLFFLSTSGSVNRSINPSEGWYYRAGADRGRQEITLFRVGKGILPIKERLVVEVV